MNDQETRPAHVQTLGQRTTLFRASRTSKTATSNKTPKAENTHASEPLPATNRTPGICIGRLVPSELARGGDCQYRIAAGDLREAMRLVWYMPFILANGADRRPSRASLVSVRGCTLVLLSLGVEDQDGTLSALLHHGGVVVGYVVDLHDGVPDLQDVAPARPAARHGAMHRAV